MLDCSEQSGIVLDCFSGSGSVLVAAEQAGRRARALEIDPRYVDASIKRWQARYGRPAIHQSSGRTFDELWRDQAPGK